MPLLAKFLVIAAVLALGAWFGLRALEHRALYFPDPQVTDTPAVDRLPYDEYMLTTRDGNQINAWFIPAASPPALTVLLCHGNAGNIGHRIDKAARLNAIGLNVLLFDYRGYGKSVGVPSEKGTYADADAAYQFLTETQKILSDQIVIYGESLGCVVACHHAAAALILESPFTSTIAMAHYIFPWLPVRWIIQNHYDNLSKIPQLRMPLLIMHSPHGEVIPFAMGQQLFAAATAPKTFFELTGGHNDGYAQSGTGYMKTIKEFLKS